MTVIDRLRATGIREDEAQRAALAIAAVLAIDRNIRVTDEVLIAARAGNVSLVSMLLAEEVDGHPEELRALEAADLENDGTRFSESKLRSRLGL